MNNQASEVRKKRMSQEQKWLAYVTDLRNKHDQELADLRQQLKQERNKAIDECYRLAAKYQYDSKVSLLNEILSLKNK